MADSTLSTLTAASTLDGAEIYYAVQSAADRKVTGAQIVTLVQASHLGQFATTTSAQLIAKISNPTGTGSLVFANAPTLVAPVLGNALATTLNAAASISVGSNAGSTGRIVLYGSSTGSCVVTVNSVAGAGVTFQLPNSPESDGR